MKIRVCLLGLFLLSGLGAPVLAANSPAATVDTVQMPAWLERGGQDRPLAIGMEVRNGDRIRTGTDSRVYLKLAEGSTVKLGENARLGFYSHSLRPARNFKGAMDVSGGAFRFTTAAANHLRSHRDISIRFGTATVGIRGTDVWGKSDAEGDLLLLIEGRIEVRHWDMAVEMNEPLTTFSVPRNAAAQPVTPVDPEQVKRWAQETETVPGQGVARKGGKWHVLLARVATQREALDIYDTAREAGYAALVHVRRGEELNSAGWQYEVILTQLDSQQEAVALAKKISQQLGFAAQADK
jgi:hypothetical protein